MDIRMAISNLKAIQLEAPAITRVPRMSGNIGVARLFDDSQRLGDCPHQRTLKDGDIAYRHTQNDPGDAATG